MPIEQFIKAVKGADAARSRELKMDIQTAKKLAFTLGEVMARLNGELEDILKREKAKEEIVQVQLDGGNNWK